jgi:hypothetical protein
MRNINRGPAERAAVVIARDARRPRRLMTTRTITPSSATVYRADGDEIELRLIDGVDNIVNTAILTREQAESLQSQLALLLDR